MQAKSVFFKTYGCSFNQMDSEIMMGKLHQKGFEITKTDENANLIVINSCTVKNLSESKFFKDITHYQSQDKKLVLTGCITQAEENYLTNELDGISVIGTNDLDQIVHVCEQTLQNNPIQFVSKLGRKRENEEQRYEKEQLRLLSPKIRSNPHVEIIPINEGCLNTCSFCKTKQARGTLFSYSIQTIKQSMQNAINTGAYEIYLTSQDTGCYGFDIGTTLPELLKELLTIKGDYKIRIGMGNPNHFKKIIDEVLDIMIKDERIYRFLHIPLQAASNRVLDEMKRMYTLQDYEEICLKAKLKIPNITLANDIIVAYPTETKEEFKETLKAIIKNGTNVLNYSRFWLRPNTPADKLYSSKQFILGDESKRRSKEIRECFEQHALILNQKWKNWQGEVIISDVSREEGIKIARNLYYKHILVEDKDNQLQIGQKVNVKIHDVDWKSFFAKRID